MIQTVAFFLKFHSDIITHINNMIINRSWINMQITDFKVCSLVRYCRRTTYRGLGNYKRVISLYFTQWFVRYQQPQPSGNWAKFIVFEANLLIICRIARLDFFFGKKSPIFYFISYLKAVKLFVLFYFVFGILNLRWN